MPWQLEISVIDVGQGDSSLIIAHDGLGHTRSMLIDAGLVQYGEIVHSHVQTRLNAVGANGLDHILVSHYDEDHVGGVLALLLSDNFSAICGCLASAAIAAFNAANTATVAQRTAAAAAAAAAAAWGGYAAAQDYSALAAKAGAQAAALTLAGTNSRQQNAQAGVVVGRNLAGSSFGNPYLIRSSQSCGTAAVAAALGALAGMENFPARQQAFTEKAIFEAISNAVPGSFMTGGLYRTTQVIDAGNLTETPGKWADIIQGSVLMWSDAFPRAPGPNRIRSSVSPNVLGSEVLWNSGPTPVAAPATSPAAFLVTGLGYVWGKQTGAPPISSGQRQNDVAIGLVVRFGDFFYFTAGDLPAIGEELVAQRVRSTGFPNPQGGQAFAPAQRIAAFKVGHHGSDGSTSDPFLQAIAAQSAFISCGWNRFGKNSDPHPTQNVINRLNARVPRFFLTNCKFHTLYVPASSGQDQLTDVQNRSRVCGDNADDNVAVHRYRGNSQLVLNDTESTGQGVPRQFHVGYWDNDDLRGPIVKVIGPRMETHPF
jgi:beta-lactamase superfamily II metal-dependent hydrolase